MEFNPITEKPPPASLFILINRDADEYIDVCLKYNFPVDLQFFRFKHEMWSTGRILNALQQPNFVPAFPCSVRFLFSLCLILLHFV